MNITEFAFRIILLFLPGIIVYTIVDELTHQREHKTHQVVIYPLLYAIICYILYYFGISIIKCYYSCRGIAYDIPIHLFESISGKEGIEFREITIVSLLAFIVVGPFFSYIRTHKWIHRTASYLKITQKNGDIDLFSHLVWSKTLKTNWVVIRDFENDIAYFGWLAAHSVGSEKDEIILFNVTIHQNRSGESIGETPAIYIPIKREKLVVEFLEVDYNKWR